MIKRYKQRVDNRKIYRVNERIFAHTLRVLDSEGKQIGVISKFEALQKAKDLGLDLVEIAAGAKPPVAKIIDFKKFLYQEAKKSREEKKKAKTSETKEVRLGPFMSDNDLSVMTRRAKDFLEDGNKVKLVITFSGRQVTHPEFGHKILDKILADLASISKIERERRLEGKKLMTIISPEKRSLGNIKTEDVQNEEKN
nr:translation initiation factor IF-3 [Candidatus Levybacteria bacterium]